MKSKFFYLSTLHFLNDGFSAAILLFLPFIAKDLHLNLAQVGVLGTSINILPIALALPTVFFAQKFGNFKTILGALFVYGLGYMAISFSGSFAILIGAFVLTGIGFGLFHPIAFSSLSRWSERSNIGRNMGNFTAWGDVGRLVISGAVSYLIILFTWQHAMLLYGLIILLAFSYLYIFHFKKNYLADDKTVSFHKHSFAPLFKNKKFLSALGCCALDNLASSPLFLFLPFLLLSRNIQPTFLSSFAGAFLIGNMLGKVVLGGWVDRLGSTKVFIVTEVIMAFFILLLVWASSPWLIAGIAIVLGIATRGTIPATRSLVYKSVHESGNFERANSLVELGNMSAAASAPLILGIISNKFGINSAFWACAGFALLAVIPALFYSHFKNQANMNLDLSTNTELTSGER